MYVYVMCVGMHISWHTCRGQRTACRTQFSPSTVWDLRVKLWSSGLTAGALIHSAISLSLSPEYSAIKSSALFFEAGSLSQTQSFLAGLFQDLSQVSLKSLASHHHTPHLPGFWGAKLRSFCLHSKGLNH